ncbi:GNAT family N-acetyltransferase [Thalassotalea atypica]|uniref:GNAT family N-acetyltransferase n=1 Tax=Thalassotalea atypica TaxID=2054316 RepID=UPI002573BC67|nr:GNAT family N-acetyltransferase [Thalassotalea atypica]
MSSGIVMEIDDLSRLEVIQLLQDHLEDMRKTSPPESIHALDLSGLQSSDITFWSCWLDNQLVGCIALKELDQYHGEIKSMRTTSHARNQGVGTQMLTYLLRTAKARGYQQVSLEKGSMTFFEPARNLYLKQGFELTGPFADYEIDPNSLFMTQMI